MNGQEKNRRIDAVTKMIEDIDAGTLAIGQQSSLQKLFQLNEKLSLLLKDGRLHTRVLQH